MLLVLRLARYVLVATTVVVVVAGCGATREPDTEQRATTPSATRPAQTTPKGPADRLPITRIAGELVMTKLVGAQASKEELAAVSAGIVGGIVLFGPNVQDAEQVRALVRSLDDARRARAVVAGLPPGMLVSVDQEGGSIRNVPFSPPESSAPEIGSNADLDQPRAIGVATGRDMRGLGISMVLGPVADLAEPPNRTMAGRAFGSEGADVAPYVSATIDGIQLTKVAAAAKHFPGFGASTRNSDLGIATIDLTPEQIASNDLLPFKAAVHARVDAIMVSHGIYRGLGSSRPAILEPLIVTNLLRKQLGFSGVAMTDSMNAKGFRDAWGGTVPDACHEALKAGIELLLLTGSLENSTLCRRAFIEAVRAGTLSNDRVRGAVRRVERLRARVALGPR
ncbi:MAG: glycoside hydrolase family 3 domain protein [Thermoleophilia bacterium]|nr:glycoside hydrolase family 3 domain protein [Thermoleophilia bacterium]